MIFQTKSVGIDIQADSIRIAVATLSGGKTRVLNLIYEEIGKAPEQESRPIMAAALKRLLKENGLEGKPCAICLPSGMSISRVLTSPISDPAKIRKTLKFQLEPQIPYPIDQVVSDYMPIGKAEDGTLLLAIAASKGHISERLDITGLAGIDVQILTLDSLALADFYFNPFDFSTDKTTALLHTSDRSSFLGFFQGERLIGYRNLDGMAWENIDATHTMVKEVRRSLVALQSSTTADTEIGTLCVAGANAHVLHGILQDSFRDVPVKTIEFNENRLAEIPPSLSGIAEGFELAIALAHTGLGTSANAINLMREEFAPVSVFSRVKSSIFFSLVILAIGLVAWFGSVLAQIQYQSRQLKLLHEEMLQVFAETLPGIKSPSDAEKKIKQEQEKFRNLRNYSSEYVSPLDVLAEVTANIPDKEKLVLGDLVLSDNVLRMTGEVDSFDSINIFNQQLEDSSLLSQVKIDSATKAEKGEKINFRAS
jgi:Tfp pilus assembly protein PilN